MMEDEAERNMIEELLNEVSGMSHNELVALIVSYRLLFDQSKAYKKRLRMSLRKTFQKELPDVDVPELDERLATAIQRGIANFAHGA